MIAELCGVSHELVDRARPQLAESANATRTTADGREYPATRRTSVTFAVPEPDEDEGEDKEEDEAPAHVALEAKDSKRPVGMTMAMEAINILRRIPEADPMRLAGRPSWQSWHIGTEDRRRNPAPERRSWRPSRQPPRPSPRRKPRGRAHKCRGDRAGAWEG